MSDATCRPQDEPGDPFENEPVTGALPADGEQDVSQDADVVYSDDEPDEVGDDA